MITTYFNFFNLSFKMVQNWSVQQLAEFFNLIGKHNIKMISSEDNSFIFEDYDKDEIVRYCTFIHENF